MHPRVTLPLRMLSVVAMTAASMAAAPSAFATTPGTNGRIVYSADFGTGFQLFTVAGDGSGIRQITNQPGIDHVFADWGPQGRRLAFERGAPDHVGVALINPDGRGQHDLTPTGIQGQPAFTADGSHIVYERVLHNFTDDSLWVMRRDGTGMRRLTRNPFPGVGGDTDPNVSPDGKVISFVRTKESSVLQALFSVHLDGTHLRQLTAYSLEVAVKHDWSPDGSHIVLTTNADFVRPGDSANLATVRPDGSGLRNLTRYRGGAVNAFAGSYSPDGRWIVYRFEDHGTYALYKIHPDGTGRRLILSLPVKPRFIDWGSNASG